MIKTYSELMTIPTYEERIQYLMLFNTVGALTFGFDRYLNQNFYTSREWRHFRRDIIVRDNGCDLSIDDRPIFDTMVIHHIEPIAPEDIHNMSYKLLDPNNVILTSLDTHNTIHYGVEIQTSKITVDRTPNDTCPWK